ncbi:MAG: hypothetical protein KGI00_00675 [Candidatus Micrarchaeota archaeon]|nr:hypothetical protein [Candidatus Micrarchaeota archaeon]MDE1824267.1 hypothetical protein [Candidatus Micrarchaeota archaeon]MDE1849227.1 hypothetical protein [Candidatus Micrarchaeota archaeon]
MNKEKYLWIALFVVIAAGALYYRLFYQPTLLIKVGAPQNYTAQQVYPYQKLQLPVIVTNQGSSAIRNITVGFVLNGNTTTIYSVTLPPGKQLTLYFNYSPTSSGTYSFTAIVDPDKLYNIGNRASTVYSTSFIVVPAENATPYTELPRFGNLYDSYDMNSQGALLSSLLSSNYSVSKVSFSRSFTLNSFLTPMVYVAGRYIQEIRGAYGSYSDGAVYSIWVRGYVAPGIVKTLADGKSLLASNYTINGMNVTFVPLGNSTRLCSWYQRGWLKLLATYGSMNCTSLLQDNAPDNLNASISTSLIDKLPTHYGPVIANYTRVSGDFGSAGRLFLLNGSAMLEFIETNNTMQNDICLGIINELNGTNYCSVYLWASGVPFGSTPAYSLITTKAYKGVFNTSAFSLINSSKILSQIGLNAALIESYGVKGNSTRFLSGLRNACVFVNVTIGCFNVTFENSTVGFDVMNNYSAPVSINSANCSWHGPGLIKKLGYTLKPGATAHISSSCYDNFAPIQGIPLNLYLHTYVNMTIENKTQIVNGTAYII